MSCTPGNAKKICDSGGSSGIPKFVPPVTIKAHKYNNPDVDVPSELRPLAYVLARYKNLQEFRADLERYIQADYERVKSLVEKMEAERSFRDEEANRELQEAREVLVQKMCKFAGFNDWDLKRTRFDLNNKWDAILSKIRESARWSIPDRGGDMAMGDLHLASLLFVQDFPDEARLLYDYKGDITVRVIVDDDDLDHDTVEQLLEDGMDVPFETVVRYPDLVERFGL